MKSCDELLDELLLRGVALDRRGDNLVLTGALEQLPDALLQSIRERKPEILARELRHIHDGTRQIPASHGQAGLAFLNLVHPRSTAFNVAASLILRGPCNATALNIAWRHMLVRHEGLRLRLVRRAGEVYAQSVPVSMLTDLAQHVDLRGMSRIEGQERLEKLRQEIAATEFDLEQGPLWRCLFVQRDAEVLELILVMHHFITDGWSLANALRELATAYSQACYGQSVQLRTLESSYGAYAAWQRATLRSASGQDALRWWALTLEGLGSPLSFPTDRPRTAVPSDSGDRISFSLTADMSRLVRMFAAQRRSTVSDVLSAVHAVLLHHYSRTERFLIGLAVSNRPTRAYRDVFGFFVNWLPVVADFCGSPSFEEFFARWRTARLAALAHQDTPFDAIAVLANCYPSLSHHPLFQHMVVSHVPARGVMFDGLEASIEPLNTYSSKVDLTLFITDSRGAIPMDSQGDLYLELEYNTGLFEPSSVDRIARNFSRLIDKVLTHPFTPVDTADIELSPCATATTIRQASKRTNITSPLALLEESAQRCSHHDAIVFNGRTTTYGTFRARALHIAEALRKHGVRPGDRVALMAPRTPDLIATFVAVLACRAIVVPIESTLPPQRIANMLEDCQPKLLVTSKDAASADVGTAASRLEHLFLEQIDTSELSANARFDGDIQASDAAYILYTSGTTGYPKGVLGAHGALANFIAWLNAYLRCGPGDRVLAKTPLSFDASLRETVAALCTGATVILADDETHTNARRLLDLVVAEGVTVVHATPTVYRAMLMACRAQEFPPTTLRHVMCGGEPLSSSLAASHMRTFPKAQLHNVYGPTECTVDVTVHRVEAVGRGIMPLGKPIDGASVYVADCELKPVPDGALGEIVIAGSPVGPGYWRRPSEQSANFAVATAGPHAGQRVYRTGDLGRRQPEGDLLFEGRSDRQLKIRGARVELGEVEAALLEQSDVADAAVLVTSQAVSVHRLTAFIVLDRGVRSDGRIDDLHRSLKLRLPPYMRPSEIIVLEGMPILSSGKRDWTSLQALIEAAPWTPGRPTKLTKNQQAIGALMAELLDMPVMSAKVDFFRAGGHSLNAARLLARIHKHCGVAITMRELFADASVAGLAALVEKRQTDPLPEGAPIAAAMTSHSLTIATSRRPRGGHG